MSDQIRISIVRDEKVISEYDLSYIFDIAPVGMILIDKESVIKMANRSFLAMLGRPKEEIVRRRFGDAISCVHRLQRKQHCGSQQECHQCPLHDGGRLIRERGWGKEGFEQQYILLDHNGLRELWLKLHPMPLTIEGRAYMLLIVHDLTKIKTAEKDLLKYQLLSENANDIIMFTDVAGKIIEVNEAALTAYGYTKKEMLGQSIFALIYPDHHAPVRTQSHQSHTEGIYYEGTARRKDGGFFTVEVSLQSTKIGEDKVLLSIQRDITERKEARKALERARQKAEAANVAKSEFLANMSHEIRTPLNGMLGMIDLTLLTELTPEQKDNLAIAKACAANLLNLINDILDFSRIEARKLTVEKIDFALRELIEQTVKPHSLAAREKNLLFTHGIDAAIPEFVKGDPHRLKQILNNLLANAVKFTDTGQIRLTVKLKKQVDNQLILEVLVKDTGIGMDRQTRAKIFETFNQADTSITRKYGGSGLGLAITKQLVEMMGGTVWVESEKGKGSSFAFTINLTVGQKAGGPKQVNPVVDKSESPMQILVAEDDKINQVVMARLLGEAGHLVETANNGREAVAKAATETFDLILMDIQMPEMDGIEAVKRIRKQEQVSGRHIPIIAITAYALQGDRKKFLDAGMDGYIAKPVQIGQLLQIIAEIKEKATGSNAEKTTEEHANRDLLAGMLGFPTTVGGSGNIDQVLLRIGELLEQLKAPLAQKDWYLIEKHISEVKGLAQGIDATNLKRVAFKSEMAARKEALGAVIQFYQDMVNEFGVLQERYHDHAIETKRG